MTNIAAKPLASPVERSAPAALDQPRERSGAVPSILTQPPFLWTRRDEQTLPVQVEGELPAWLQGDLLRTAPAIFDAKFAGGGGWQAQHLFDGLGLIYGFSFHQGVRFQQQLLASRAQQEIAQGRAQISSFGTDMQRNLWQRVLAPIPEITDNANVNIIPWQGAWLAMTETPKQHVIDGVSYGSRGLYSYEDDLPSTLAMTAHPHFDLDRQALVNIGISFGPKNELLVYRQGADSKKRVVEGKLAFKNLPYVHDFGLSQKHAVIVDHPLSIHPLKLLFSNHGFKHAFRWQPERGTRLWKLDRETGTWTDYLTESLFCFHTVNTFDDGDDLVLDFLAYDDASIVSQLQIERLAREGLPELTGRYVRARLRPGRRHVELERLSSQSFEFPNIAYHAQHGRAYDVVWGASFERTPPAPSTRAEASASTQDTWHSSVVRIDTRSGAHARFAEPGITYSEPVFVARPGASRADDGVLLTLGSHQDGQRSTLAVLDATTLAPLARCVVELSLPLGFHGNFQAS